MICSKCGANNIEGQTFCGSCGSPLESGISIPAEPQDNYQKAEKTYNADVTNAYTTPPGGPSNGGMVKPKSYLTESIIVTVISAFCCCMMNPISLVLGIIGIVKANKVDSSFNTGNASEAIQNAEAAKKLVLWAVIIGVAGAILYAILNFWLFRGSSAYYEEIFEELLQQYQ
jgi:hypothetical protein